MTVSCPKCGAEAVVGPDDMARCPCGLTGYIGYVNEYNYLTTRLDWLRDRLDPTLR